MVFNERLEGQEIFSVVLCDFPYFLQVFIQILDLPLRLAVRVDLELTWQHLIE